MEFKKKADHPEKIVREMVAFANSGGGVLLIGVEDNGRISGLKSADEEQFVMEAAMWRYAKPQIPFQLLQIPVGSGRFVLKYQILNGTEKPYYWLENPVEQKYRVYVRSEDQSVRASYEVYRILRSTSDEAPVVIGNFELDLFEALRDDEEITINAFCKLVSLSRKKVSSRFISLVRQGVLEVKPRPVEDHYRLTDAYVEKKFSI